MGFEPTEGFPSPPFQDGAIGHSAILPNSGVSEEVRSLNLRNHNPLLYQLSYTHHIEGAKPSFHFVITMPVTVFFFIIRRGIMVPALIVVTVIPIPLSLPIFFPTTKPTIITNFPTFKQMFELRGFEGYFGISLKILARSVISQSLEFLVFLIAAICVLFVTSAHCSKPPERI